MRRAAMLAAALALVIAALVTVAGAQTGTGQINGQVFDKARKGVPGLTVAAFGEALPLIYGTSTDRDGRYAFRGLAVGTYAVVVAPAGRSPLRKDGIRVRPLFRSIVDFTLGGDAPAEVLPPVSPAPVEGADTGLVLDCSVTGPEREAVPGIAITLTPMEGSGQLRRARTEADGTCVLREIDPGRYRVAVRAPGFMTWGLGPVAIDGSGKVSLSLSLVTFPLNFKGTVEDALVPADPIPPPR